MVDKPPVRGKRVHGWISGRCCACAARHVAWTGDADFETGAVRVELDDVQALLRVMNVYPPSFFTVAHAAVRSEVMSASRIRMF